MTAMGSIAGAANTPSTGGWLKRAIVHVGNAGSQVAEFSLGTVLELCDFHSRRMAGGRIYAAGLGERLRSRGYRTHSPGDSEADQAAFAIKKRPEHTAGKSVDMGLAPLSFRTGFTTDPGMALHGWHSLRLWCVEFQTRSLTTRPSEITLRPPASLQRRTASE